MRCPCLRPLVNTKVYDWLLSQVDSSKGWGIYAYMNCFQYILACNICSRAICLANNDFAWQKWAHAFRDTSYHQIFTSKGLKLLNLHSLYYKGLRLIDWRTKYSMDRHTGKKYFQLPEYVSPARNQIYGSYKSLTPEQILRSIRSFAARKIDNWNFYLLISLLP